MPAYPPTPLRHDLLVLATFRSARGVSCAANFGGAHEISSARASLLIHPLDTAMHFRRSPALRWMSNRALHG